MITHGLVIKVTQEKKSISYNELQRNPFPYNKLQNFQIFQFWKVEFLIEIDLTGVWKGGKKLEEA